MKRDDPERRYQARRSALLDDMRRSASINEDDGERLMAAWERQAATQGLDRFMNSFWDSGERWIWDQSRVRPEATTRDTASRR